MIRSHVRRTFTALVLCALMLATVAGPALARPASDKTKDAKAKNVIIMISDGMGYNQMLAGDYYLYGAPGASFGDMPYKSAMSTYSYYGGYDPSAAWSDFNYVKMAATDSAAAATAMSTGVKTYDAGLGVDVDGQRLTHMMEVAEGAGKATGVVTSVEWSHATPAGFVAHNASRNNYSAIGAEIINSSSVDVVMGTGHPWYDNSGVAKTTPNTYNYVGGQTTWDALVAGTAGGDADGDGDADPFTLIQDRAEFQALAEGETPGRVCGTAKAYTTLQQARAGNAYAGAFAVPLTQSVPTLPEMTAGALNVLDNDTDGFVLMVEGGAVDWASHANQSGRTIEEQADFIASVEAVKAWVEKNSNWGETLLVVTGDHETGYLTGPGSGQFSTGPVWNPLVNYGALAMPGMQWNSGDHTNSLIPFFAKGSAARFFKTCADQKDPVRGAYLDNTELATVCIDLLEQ
jgi:alkaline phosphatase